MRRARGRAAIEEAAVVPGLVDAHVHLQIDALDPEQSSALPAGEFVPWARAVMAARGDQNAADWLRAAQQGAWDRLTEGATAVGEIDSTGLGPAALRPIGIGGRCYQELTGFHLDARAAAILARDRARASGLRLAAGLSPHAPYSVSPELFRSAARRARWLAVHCAETPAEQEFLRAGTGPFAELLADLGRLPSGHRAPGVGAVRWLERLGLLRPSVQLVHCQDLEAGDVERIAAARAPVVVCPGTIAWFGRPVPPVEAWLAAGITVALGTDSRASNRDWSMRAALRDAARLWPGLAPETLLTMATAAGGRALGTAAGRLRVGAAADFLVLPLAGPGAEASPRGSIAAFVHGDLRIHVVYVRGRRLAPRR